MCSKSVKQAKVEELAKIWKIDKNKFTILLPGRLTRWKGQESFIEALSYLREIHNKDNFQAVILGSDQGRNIYSKKLSLLVERYRLGKKIFFIENCKEMPIAYKLADVVVSSSIEPEAFGRVSVEAQAMNKPIIASNIGGSKETINENKTGFLFEANNSDDLSKKLIEIMNLDEQTINQMGIEGRKNVVSKFNVEKMCFSTYSEYKKLIN